MLLSQIVQEELERWEETYEEPIEDKENPVAERAVEALVALGGTNVHQYRGPHRVSALHALAKPLAYTEVGCLICAMWLDDLITLPMGNKPIRTVEHSMRCRM